jgi:hypothetical protein
VSLSYPGFIRLTALCCVVSLLDKQSFKMVLTKPGTVPHAYNPSLRRLRSGGSGFQGQLGEFSEINSRKVWLKW